MKTKKIEVWGDISSACAEAVATARAEQCKVEFKFNDRMVTALPDSDPAALAEGYMEACRKAHEIWLASPECKKREEEYAAKAAAKNKALAEALATAPAEMSFADKSFWDKQLEVNKDGYGGGILSFANRWARLMEARIAKGEQFKDFAKETSHLADNEGITGFMYGAAVSVLSKVWAHGEKLRKWHNLDTQIGKEGEKANENGGVLNPALLNVG